MNSIVLTGRLTKDIELKKTPNDKSVTTFTLVVYENKQTSYFINCVSWNQTAELLSKYAKKGTKIGVSGKITSRSYDGKNGKVYVTEVLVNNIELLDSKPQEEKSAVPQWEDYKSNTPQLNGEDIDNLPFY